MHASNTPTLSGVRTSYRPLIGDWGIAIFGVVLPAAAIAIEWASGWCAQTFFNPIPTVWHALLASTVPLSNLLTWQALRQSSLDVTSHRGFPAPLALFNGFTIAVAAFFTAMFAPLSILGAFAILLFGLGLLPMAPLLSLVVAAVLRSRLWRASASAQASTLLAGIALAAVALGAAQFRISATTIGLDMAASDDPVQSLRGIRFLRAWGSQDAMLEACYVQPSDRDDVLGRFITRDVATEEARRIFYRVTGMPFSALAAPRRLRTDDWFDGGAQFDANLGDEVVGQRLRDVSLASSRLDGLLDAGAAAAYLEWTLVFDNTGAQQREARMQALLPDGGVVSRLTLWVDGEEREAAFGKRSQVRQAYRSVAIQQRRDPVLITTAGTDRVLIQCFPIPPRGQMKIRFGITAPLELPALDKGALKLPSIVERNFAIPGAVRHAVWLEGADGAASPGEALKIERSPAGQAALRGEIADEALAPAAITIARDPADTKRVQDDPAGQIVQDIVRGEQAPSAGVVVVVDGSASLAGAAERIAGALAELPADSTSVIFVGDEILQAVPSAPGFVGGADNAPALIAAWDQLAAAPNARILWLHGPQPELFQSIEPLRQRWERRPDGPRLISIQITPGPNRILEQLDGIAAVRSTIVPPESDLAAHLVNHVRGGERWSMTRQRSGSTSASAPKRGSHIARLWAAERVKELLRQIPPATGEAIALAAKYQLVTPVTGAVVLETQQQFAQAGLKPVDSAHVPVVPEPRLLPIIALAALAWWFLQRNRRERVPVAA